MRFLRTALLLPLLLFAPAFAADPFAENVRSTPPRSPEDQRAALHVPEGFEVQLVASEPDIAKPMNLAFDARGRLWVSVSREYPFPAPATQPARDSIKIFENFDPATGRARKITTFAENLNIPIGLYPYGDGVIAYSIPRISFYHDTNNDGRCDKVEPLIGDFGYLTDTHGMASNFRRGFDGFLYACHGFNNRSIIKGTDGKGLELNSGNTFRFRVDGSGVEQFTWGQTNPFGLSFDANGNAYTSDSHSKPIYQLLRGGYYEGIGKAHDGLGFAPAMMSHTHGSTAIAGLCILADERWPADLRNNILVGNVVTSRLNRDKISFTGSTPAAHEQSDFVKSDDPWFRPNNTVLGPDGALYVADFYNRIIGHYEVPLDHPGRDRERGRIWRIVHRDLKNEPLRDLTKLDTQQLIALLDHPNLTLRMLATDQISDRIGTAAGLPLRESLKSVSPTKTVHILWILFRLEQLNLADLQSAAKHADALVRVHTQRMLSETQPWTPPHRELALSALSDPDPLVARCAADALAQHPQSGNIQPLLALLNRADSADTHLRHSTRIALKGQLTSAGYGSLASAQLDPKDAKELADVSLAVQTPDAARFLASHLELFAKDRALLAEVVRHVAQLSGGTGIDPLVALTRQRFADDPALQLELLGSIRQGVAQHGGGAGAGDVSPDVRDWATEVAGNILKSSQDSSAWICLTLDGAPSGVGNIFSYEPRRSTDKSKPTAFLSSLPAGERATGILRSPPFAVPSQLSFFIAGHNGFPANPSPQKNLVRLCDAKTGKVLSSAGVPRNDIAHTVKWDLADHAGQQAVLEIVDGDDGTTYAWIAIARVDPPVVALPADGGKLAGAAQLAATFKLASLAPALKALFESDRSDLDTRLAAATALLAMNDTSPLSKLAELLADAALPLESREKIAAAIGESKTPQSTAALLAAIGAAPARLQNTLARALTSTPDSAEQLLSAIAAHKAPPRLLHDRELRERLRALNLPNLEARIASLTQGIERPGKDLAQLINKRRGGFNKSTPDARAGATVFTKNCAICHQLDGAGAIVGPQLNGISKRGLDRILEDILDPNRNLDPAFRYSSIILKNNTLITGLQQKSDDTSITFTDTTGKEITIPKDQIKKRIESNSSLMPINFGDVLSEQDLINLLAYLMTK